MASEQVMLSAAALLMALLLSACQDRRVTQFDPGPYPQRQVWAVVPLRNESGSLEPDGARIADALAHQIELIPGVETLPVNRVLAAMGAMNLQAVTSPPEAMRLRETLGADALVVGTVSAFDPYNPPKMGMSVELYGDPRHAWYAGPVDLRRLTSAATDAMTRPDPAVDASGQPITVVSGFFDGADPQVRGDIQKYARGRSGHDENAWYWRQYYLSMDLFTEYVSHTVATRLMQAERARLLAAQQQSQAADQAASKD